MPGPEFFQTGMGRGFYDGTMPRIAIALERIADAIEKSSTKPFNLEGVKTGRFSSTEPNASNTPKTNVDAAIDSLSELVETYVSTMSPVGVAMLDEDLDDIVHELASSEASACNNGGSKEQVKYLVEKLGLVEAISTIHRIVKQAWKEA